MKTTPDRLSAMVQHRATVRLVPARIMYSQQRDQTTDQDGAERMVQSVPVRAVRLNEFCPREVHIAMGVYGNGVSQSEAEGETGGVSSPGAAPYTMLLVSTLFYCVTWTLLIDTTIMNAFSDRCEQAGMESRWAHDVSESAAAPHCNAMHSCARVHWTVLPVKRVLTTHLLLGTRLRRRTGLKMGKVLFSESFLNLLVGIRLPAWMIRSMYEVYQGSFTFVAFAVTYTRLNPFRCQNKAIVQYLSKVSLRRSAER